MSEDAERTATAVQPLAEAGAKGAALTALLANIAALLLVTMSVTMLADFTRRLFGADPDELGIFAIAVQATLTISATGMLTRAGWALLDRLLGKEMEMSTAWRLSVTAILFAATAATWMWAPHWLANRYNTQAYFLNQSLAACGRGDKNCDVELNKNPAHYRALVLRNYQRAVSLDPAFWVARTNSGRMLESFYRYQEAGEQYRRALQAEPADEVDLTPYSNLARTLLLDGKPKDALRVIADAERLPAGDKRVKDALARDRAWAEYDLGFYEAAARDATTSGTAAAICIQAQAYRKLGRGSEERAAWIVFRKQYAVLTWDDPAVDPECRLLAEAVDGKH